MCGRLSVAASSGVKRLIQQLNIQFWSEPLQEGRFLRAASPITIIREQQSQRRAEKATWWLLLERTESSFKPSKYTSFNTRYDKLNVLRSAGFEAFRKTRCIIPASGFGETEYVNKKPIHYYDFEALEGEAIAFGGLYREWLHPLTGERALSCSVITLPPHNKLKHIHSKAMPLMLPQGDEVMNMWLDSSLTDNELFNDLLKPNLPQDLITYQIDKPSTHQQISERILIPKDS
ncbi:SOS response-associated peptidase family protein [Pseudoalteromonas sp. BDTF-M6]|uniref:SOS response-associated peptidase family protein n=1 Tax=Pseudoalteromonas sp. BDTF-M6 TaxID=2796132 RepID=UPI001BAFCBA2|nr:SOS response-associated peptidase family protein [Pseudoalteromonas sp. BDTF-M6]MBS3796364.1 SOS response-associated peptidase family protein [Pseudoalteromonas sp. BDTF-M6]